MTQPLEDYLEKKSTRRLVRYAAALLVIMLCWTGIGVTRQQLLAHRIARAWAAHQSAQVASQAAGRAVSVNVPLVPLLLNPFQQHPPAFLVLEQNGFPLAQVQT